MEFNDYYYVNNLLDKLSKENKTVFLLGDFNIDSLNCDQHSPLNEYHDSLSSHMLLPHISRINNFLTLTDSSYSNVITTCADIISDHLPQFFVAPGIFSNPPSAKLNISEKD